MNTRELTRLLAIGSATVGLSLAGCGKPAATPPTSTPETTEPETATPETTEPEHTEGGQDHGHGEEVSLGTTDVGNFTIECWQGHGTVAPGKVLHLVVKLPYNDSGASVVRAWIGTEDRLASIVGKGEYAASHDDYDLHAEAPAPLPEGARWWIEIERPDGTKEVGSIGLR